MKNIVALAASNSKRSINKQLVSYVTEQISGFDNPVLDLNDFNLPIYSPDLQEESGMPAGVTRFAAMISSCDGIILSIAEHNGYYSAAFKNLLDWTSRLNRTFLAEKPMLLMAASPGPKGGQHALKAAHDMFPFFGGNIAAEFSLPSFYDNFRDGQISDKQLSETLKQKTLIFQESIELQLSITRFK